VFRRSSAGAAEGTAQGSQSPQGTQTEEAPAKNKPSAAAGKGRPTPKRASAEANRYRTITGSTTSGRGRDAAPGARRKLTPEEKAKAREDRSKQMAAMRRGEDWALGPRDRGPAKQLVRDYVDSHRRPMEYYMYALILLVVALFAGRGHSALSEYMQLFLLGVIVVIVIDGYFLRRSVLKAVQDRLPGQPTRGLALYAIMRALQLRRFRTPTPRVQPGGEY
jgi:Protein of unknown function (DUF3043)